jgi:peptidoglycan/xylan/chitin deacetylase (PgdA/CDA1 family)
MERQEMRGGRRGGRFLWITLAAVFLALLGVVLWVWVRTRAGDGYGFGWAEPSLRGAPAAPHHTTQAAGVGAHVPAPEDCPAVGRPAADEIVYHSRFNDRMEIALSFDDGPHPRLTPVILDILEEYGIKATFFMVGENVGYYPAAARAVVEAGHEIANHTFSHRKFGKMTEGEMREEIAACEQALTGVTESPVHFIRPPEGQMNDTMLRVAGSLDYRVILWDVDTRDWAHTPPAEISRHILDTVQAGDIILMHDFIGHDSPTPEALRRVIPELLARGYRFVTVGELVEGESE